MLTNERATRVSCTLFFPFCHLYILSALIRSLFELRFARNVTLFESRTTGIITTNYTLLIRPVIPFSLPCLLSLFLGTRFCFLAYLFICTLARFKEQRNFPKGLWLNILFLNTTFTFYFFLGVFFFLSFLSVTSFNFLRRDWIPVIW